MLNLLIGTVMSKKMTINEVDNSSNQNVITDSETIDLLNMDDEKLTPFVYHSIDGEIGIFIIYDPIIKIIENIDVIQDEDKLIHLDFDDLNIQKILTLEYQQSDLLFGYNDNQSYNVLDLYFNTENTIDVCLKYPFDKTAHLVIPPLSTEYENKSYSVGYILWQISRAYEEIYLYMWKEVGVWEYKFDKLAFRSLTIYKNNKISVNVVS
jgi:hypothetical protein